MRVFLNPYKIDGFSPKYLSVYEKNKVNPYKMVKLNKSDYLPPVRLVENEKSLLDIRRRFSTAFGYRHAVHWVQERGEYKVVHFAPPGGYNRPLSEWDKFYEDLDEYGKLWVDYTKILPEDFHTRAEYVEYNRKHPIEYSVEPKEGCWEIQYALKRTGQRISTTSATPRYAPPPPRRSARFVQEPAPKPEIDTVAIRGLQLCNEDYKLNLVLKRKAQERVTIPRTVSIDAPVATHVPYANSVCVATVVSIPKAPKKWYSCVFPKLSLFRRTLDLDA